MKLASRTEGAIRTIVSLAMNKKEGVTRTMEISERLNLSRDYLGQILLTLKTAGIVASKRGMAGGYVLAKQPSDITLAELIDLTDTSLLRPSTTTSSSPQISDRTALRELWAETTDLLRQRMSAVTIQDLCDRIQSKQSASGDNYSI